MTEFDLSPSGDSGGTAWSGKQITRENAIPNPDLHLPVGTSAELILGTGEITAHDVPASLLTLADDGTVGVKAVDDSNRVRFHPVEIIGSTENGMLITGLPPTIRLCLR